MENEHLVIHAAMPTITKKDPSANRLTNTQIIKVYRYKERSGIINQRSIFISRPLL